MTPKTMPNRHTDTRITNIWTFETISYELYTIYAGVFAF